MYKLAKWTQLWFDLGSHSVRRVQIFFAAKLGVHGFPALGDLEKGDIACLSSETESVVICPPECNINQVCCPLSPPAMK